MRSPRSITTTISIQDEIKNLIHVWLAVIASLCYCHFISSRLMPKGKWRLISLAPIFYIFIIIPLYTTFVFTTTVTAFFITWLANFKLLLFAFDHGPIASKPAKSLPIFIAMAALPIKIRPENDGPTPKKPKKLPLYLATEIPIFAITISILHDYKEYFHHYIVLFAYCCLIFLFVDIMVEASGLLVHALFGLEPEPASDEPYLSTSVQEFWSRRWNITVSSILRETVYGPIRSAAAAVVGREWAALAAVMAAFLVSGLMHELMAWYVTRAAPSWEVTAYFVVQGVCVVVEYGIKVAFSRKKWGLHWFLRCLVAVGLVVGTSFRLLFPPLTRNGADVRVVEELVFGGEAVKEKVKGIWLHMGQRY